MKSISTFDVFKHVKSKPGMVEVSGDALVSLQSVLTMMLCDVDAVCTSQGIDYMLGGGNMIGALRHHGFIPWDDDADINMPHSQFNRFAEELEKRFPGKYLVQMPGKSADYELAFPRLRLRGTVYRGKDDLNTPSEACGVYVDVFYLENVPKNPLLHFLHGIGSMALGLGLSCRKFAAHADEYKQLLEDGSDEARIFRLKTVLGRAASFLSVPAWISRWDRWNSLCKDDESEYVVCPTGRRHYFKEHWKRSDLFPALRVPFEGHSLCVPRGYDALLRGLYGDYMKVPAVEDQETHVVYEFDLGKYGETAAVTGGATESQEKIHPPQGSQVRDEGQIGREGTGGSCA